MDLIFIFLAGFFALSKGEGGCKVLDYLACMKNKTFTGHVIKSFRILAPGLEDCQHKCFLEDNCVSYNLGPVGGMARSCEVNDADHVSDPSHVVSKEDFEYCPIKNPCSSSPCPSNQWCTPDFHWNTFKCSDGKWSQWSQWSPCRCPQMRNRTCMTPMNTSVPLSCEGSKEEGPKECASATDIMGCSGPLGMQDGSIPDAQITASSTFSTYYPHNGRLHNPRSWMAYRKTAAYLQIDLGFIKWVTKIATQGLNVDYHEWVKEYTLSFTNDTSTWEEYKGDQHCTKTFIGNSDRNTVVTRELPVPVKTRYVRIHPQLWHNDASMRVELYGCTSV